MLPEEFDRRLESTLLASLDLRVALSAGRQWVNAGQVTRLLTMSPRTAKPCTQPSQYVLS